MIGRRALLAGLALAAGAFLAGCEVAAESQSPAQNGATPLPSPAPSVAPPSPAPTPERAAASPTPEAPDRIENLSANEYLSELSAIHDPFKVVRSDVAVVWRVHRPIAASDLVVRTFWRANMPTVLRSIRRQLDRLSPPEQFEADHNRYLEVLQDGISTAIFFSRAVIDADYTYLFPSYWRLVAMLGHAWIESSPAFCRVVALAPQLCVDDDVLAAGEYGASVHAVLSRFAVDYAPVDTTLMVMFGLFDRDHYATLVGAIGPRLARTAETARNAISALRPPAHFDRDHTRLVQLFDDLLVNRAEFAQAASEKDRGELTKALLRGLDLWPGAIAGFSPQFQPVAAPLGTKV